MSRIGKKPIEIPKDVQVEFKDRTLIVRGPKGELSFTIPNGIEYSYQNQTLTFSRTDDDKKVRAAHGLTRAIVTIWCKVFAKDSQRHCKSRVSVIKLK